MPQGIEINYALDTFYLLLSGLLVMCFIFGLTLWGAGLIRGKNTVDLLTKNIVLIAMGCLIYAFFGYSLMHGSSLEGHGFFPSFSRGQQTLQQLLAKDKPHTFLPGVFLQWQLAVIPLIVIATATAERLRPWILWLFAVIWIAFIYPLEGYWSWGQGFLQRLGFIDLAGSGVIHLAAAAAALAAVLLIGPRLGRRSYRRSQPILGANLPLAVLGIWFIWLGSVGLNASSQVVLSNMSAAQVIATIVINTQFSIAGSVLAVLIVGRLILGYVDLTILLNGVLAGIIAIAAAPASVGIIVAVLIGAVGGAFVLGAIVLFNRLRIDDPAGAIATHGVAGMWGLMAVVFSPSNVLSWQQQLAVQFTGLVSILLWVFVSSFIILWIFKILFGIRVNNIAENKGLDAAIYKMAAYPEFN